jgi:hypothetical protein
MTFLVCRQVLDERVYHIEYAPETPEPYYKATGKELQPRPVGEEHGIIVYNYMPISAVHYVSTQRFESLIKSLVVVEFSVKDARETFVCVVCQEVFAFFCRDA